MDEHETTGREPDELRDADGQAGVPETVGVPAPDACGATASSSSAGTAAAATSAVGGASADASASPLSAADLEVFPGAFEPSAEAGAQSESVSSLADAEASTSAMTVVSEGEAPATDAGGAVSEPAARPADAPRNPWNDPLPASYGAAAGPGVPQTGAGAMPKSAGAPRRGVPGWLIAVVVAAIVVASIVFAFAGPSLLAPPAPDPSPRGLESDFDLDPLANDDPLDDEDIQNLLDEMDGTEVAPDSLTADEQAAYDAAVARLDALATADPAETELIGSLVSDGFRRQMEVVSLEMCGVDPQEYARTMLDGLTYTVTDVCVSAEDDSAFVSATVTCRDVFAVIDEFNAMMDAYTSSEAYEVSSLEEDYERIGIMFMEAARTAGMNDGYSMDIYLDRGGDTWTVDETLWEMELDYLFDVA